MEMDVMEREQITKSSTGILTSKIKLSITPKNKTNHGLKTNVFILLVSSFLIICTKPLFGSKYF